MTDLPFGMFVGSAAPVLGLAALPLLALWVVRRNALKASRASPGAVAVIEVLVVAGIICLGAATLLGPSTSAAVRVLDFDPFGVDLDSASQRRELLGNFLMTVPIGFLAGLRLEVLQKPVVSMLTGLALVLGLEIAQYIEGWGRVASVRDVLVGAAGWMVGTAVAAVIARTGRARELLAETSRTTT